MEHPSATVDDYLQAIFSLEGEGETVISARLARRMRVTPPTAWATVRRMERDGFVQLDERKVVHLTEKGRAPAEDLVPLGSLKVGDQATVQFISEELEEDMDLLRYLERGKMMPGGAIRVVELAPSTGIIVVERDGANVRLGLGGAAHTRGR